MLPGYVFVDARTARGPDGHEYDVLDAVAKLPWVDQTCPGMRHQYAHRSKSDQVAYSVVEAVLKATNPETYKAFFRGYQTPNRYWDAPDGQRYWLTFNMINRCRPDSVEPPRRVDRGETAAKDWDTTPLAPKGSHLYERYKKGWIPTEDAIAAGYRPCASCQVHVNVRRRHLAASESHDTRAELDRIQVPASAPGRKTEADMARSSVLKTRVVRKLLELRAREAPLGSSGYRGVLSQKAIAEVAEVRVQDVTQAAIEFDRELRAAADEVNEAANQTAISNAELQT